MNLVPDGNGFHPAEVSFLSENEHIDIIPLERIDMIQLIGVRVS
jgi:hypothetical protein